MEKNGFRIKNQHTKFCKVQLSESQLQNTCWLV